MSVRFVDSEERELKMSAWSWGVLHELLAISGIFTDDGAWERARLGGGSISGAEVPAVVAFLEDDVLPCLRPGERMFVNGTITDVPDDGTFYRAESELWKNYSLSHEELVRFIGFARGAAAPIAIL